MLQQAEKSARSLRNLDRSAGDDECLDYATFVFWIGHNHACRTSASVLLPHPVEGEKNGTPTVRILSRMIETIY